LRQMFSAISYCHGQRIVHRDLKLENWMFSSKATDAPLKLIDFGFSRKFKDGTPLTRVCGTSFYVAPEVLQGSHSNECDVWSLGVITFMLLSGVPPFNGSDETAILRAVRRAEFDFKAEGWRQVSDVAKDFVRSTLNKDPVQRPSAAQCLLHPFLATPGPHSPHLVDVDVLRNIQQFAAASAMKRAALGLIAMSINVKGVSALEQEFKLLDSDRDGTVTLEDLTRVLTTQLNLNEEESRNIFSKLDVSRDSQVHYSEFLAASLMVKVSLNEEIIRSAFAKLDLDGSGKISVADLTLLLGGTYTKDEIEEMVQQSDLDGDGTIGYDEFVLMLTAGHPESPVSSSDVELQDHEAARSSRVLKRGDTRLSMAMRFTSFLESTAQTLHRSVISVDFD
jgi:calcium-dependent protein kinase